MAPGVATKCLPCQRDVHGAMAAVPEHDLPIGALQRGHSLTMTSQGQQNAPQRQTPPHWPMETL